DRHADGGQGPGAREEALSPLGRRRETMKNLFIALCFVSATSVASLGLSATASAQDVNALRVSGFLALGAGGEGKLTNPITVESDLDATVGFGLRLELPVITYLTVGAQLGFGWMKIDGVDDRDAILDLPDLIVRGRYPIELGGGVLEPYVGFLIGGTLHVLGEG